MQGVLGNVLAYDSSARKSIQNFEDGNGDVAITYENEVLTAQAAGKEDEAVYPPSSVLIENPVTVVDKNVDKHCVREVAEAFVEYLHSDEAKEIFADAGYRSTDLATAQKGGGDFPAIEDLWDVDEFGGWDASDRQALQRRRDRHAGAGGLTADERRRADRQRSQHGSVGSPPDRCRAATPRSARRRHRLPGRDGRGPVGGHRDQRASGTASRRSGRRSRSRTRGPRSGSR